MQVFGLPRRVISDAVARWLRARVDGLSADQAARAAGVGRATLYRWAARTEPRSRRPIRVRKPGWTPALAHRRHSSRRSVATYFTEPQFRRLCQSVVPGT